MLATRNQPLRLPRNALPLRSVLFSPVGSSPQVLDCPHGSSVSPSPSCVLHYPNLTAPPTPYAYERPPALRRAPTCGKSASSLLASSQGLLNKCDSLGFADCLGRDKQDAHPFTPIGDFCSNRGAAKSIGRCFKREDSPIGIPLPNIT
jgi:hypothetical protein